MMQTGDVAAALIYSGHCSRVRKSGHPVDAVMPLMANGKRGVMKNGWIGIVKGTKVSELATFYVNQFINLDFQSTWATGNGRHSVESGSAEGISFGRGRPRDVCSVGKRI